MIFCQYSYLHPALPASSWKHTHTHTSSPPAGYKGDKPLQTPSLSPQYTVTATIEDCKSSFY